MVSVSSVAPLDREKRHSGNFVLETLQNKTFHLTPACNRPAAAGTDKQQRKAKRRRRRHDGVGDAHMAAATSRKLLDHRRTAPYVNSHRGGCSLFTRGSVNHTLELYGSRPRPTAPYLRIIL